MCLDSVSKKYKQPQRKVVQAYKVFDVRYRKLHTLFYHTEKAFPLDTWIKAEEGLIQVKYFSYTAGFHAFEKKLDNMWKFVEPSGRDQRLVYLYGVHTTGTQGYKDMPTLVARWLYIPSNPTALPPAAPRRKDKSDGAASV